MKRVIQGSQVAFGTAGSAYGARTAVVVGAGANSVLPAGFHFMECDAHTTVEWTYDAGSTFVTLVAASAKGWVSSDGFNTRVLGDGTGGTAQRTQDLRVM